MILPALFVFSLQFTANFNFAPEEHEVSIASKKNCDAAVSIRIVYGTVLICLFHSKKKQKSFR